MSDTDRHSRALDAELITDPDLKAKKEVSNGLKQFDAVAEQVEYWSHPERPFKLRLSAILSLQRIVAMVSLSWCRISSALRCAAREPTAVRYCSLLRFTARLKPCPDTKQRGRSRECPLGLALEVISVRAVKTARLQAAVLKISGLNRRDTDRSCRVSPAVPSRRREQS
jgi:hypothetical protein